MNRALVTLVHERARHGCEYCQLPQLHSAVPFEIDHVVAKRHKGPTVEQNLALACFYRNSAKGPNLSGIDPDSGAIVPLFNPRRQKWSRHFRWNGPRLIGRTRSGRATIDVLAINDPTFVAMREALIRAGLFPPSR